VAASLALERTLRRLGVPEDQSVLLVRNGGPLRLDARVHTLVVLPMTSETAGALLARYPADWEAALAMEAEVQRAPLAVILGNDWALAQAVYLYLPPLPWDKDLKDFRTLVEVVAWLRAPDDGCPWDRVQTHRSLTPFLIEETYEALEEIEADNAPALREELGDILLQVALHGEIAREEGLFDVEDVVATLVSKLVRRHPHVFGDATAKTAEDVAARWEVLKSRERNGASLMAGVPPSLPALGYAQRVQDRAANVGFDWPSTDGVLDKVAEEVQELHQAPDADARAAELGDLLFSLVNLGRHWKVDVEASLREANRRFVRRFQAMEELAHERGRDFSKLPLDQQDALWAEAKRRLAAEGGRG
jgi:tetrapyrrole methylase family protein/MazG family protein